MKQISRKKTETIIEVKKQVKKTTTLLGKERTPIKEVPVIKITQNHPQKENEIIIIGGENDHKNTIHCIVDVYYIHGVFPNPGGGS